MRRLAVALSLSFLLPVVSEAVAQGGDPCFEGAFEAPFPHENLDNQFTWPATFWSNPAPAQKSPFNALHLTLIPKGPYRGRVLAWTYNFEPTVSAPIPSLHLTRWSIIQPELPNGIPSNNKFWNFELPHGENNGDLGCAVSSWTEDGRHFVAGGTTFYDPLVGAKLVYLFDPGIIPQTTVPKGANMWIRQLKSLQENRWYPSVVRIPMNATNPFGHMLVLGGADSTSVFSQTTYESWAAPAPLTSQGTFEFKSPGMQRFDGPGFPSGSPLGVYPRAHLLSNSDVFQSTCSLPTITLASMVTHHITKDSWTARGDVGNNRGRLYGSSVILPNISPVFQNAVMILGGITSVGNPPAALATDTVQYCKASQHITGPGQPCNFPNDYAWCDAPNMLHKRYAPNAVLLPDASVFVFGGENATEGYVLEAERYTLGGTWQPMAWTSSPRGYHSTAVLLPSAKVLLAGSDARTWDYEIYQPPYLHCGPRPTWVNPLPGGSSGVLSYNTAYIASYELEAPATVEKVVLMRPGALTHHYDSDQRYVQLTVQIEPGASQIQFWTPLGIPQKNAPNTPSENRAPKGYYMMFLVTNAGVPSVAHWVKLQ